MIGIIIRNRKEALERQKMKLCSSCFKDFSESNQKNLHRKVDQLYNELDQTAAESEVDQADKDTRCQSSLL